MNCPQCNHKKLVIYDSRHTLTLVVRKRRCLSCEFRFFTLERIMTEDDYKEIDDDTGSES
jgi:transcriptional regulator NrdR family protein